MRGHEPLVIERAEGCWLYTSDGRRLLDGVSSMWCNVHGHNHPRLNEAIRDQLNRVAHVTTLGMSCGTTMRLADELATRLPGDLSHVFFSSDGASAVEAAIKMALQYWYQCDSPRPSKSRYLSLGRAYHGDTTGGVSLGGIEHFHHLFKPLLFSPVRGPLPCSYRLPPSVSEAEACDYYANQMRQLLQQHHETLAAVVIEPLIQGAAGMITHPHGFLKQVRELCDEFQVLLIADEVATGFGRTGAMFACEHEGVTLDILCLGKGLTGGYLPMAATVATNRIFEAFFGDSHENRQFFHGHTFAGNPLAAAVALASLELFGEDDLVAQSRRQAARIRSHLARLESHPNVGNIRGRGMMIGVELVQDRSTKRFFNPRGEVAERICQRCLEREIWIRPLGDVLVIMPPLVTSDDEVDLLCQVVCDAIDEELKR